VRCALPQENTMRDQGVQIQKLQNAMRVERSRSSAMTAAKAQLRGEPQRRMLAFVGVSSHPSRGALRTALRKSWFPTGDALTALEEEQGIVLRFVLGQAPPDQAVGKFSEQARATLRAHVLAHPRSTRALRGVRPLSVRRLGAACEARRRARLTRLASRLRTWAAGRGALV
jgi:hypothetical protein